MVKTVQKEKTGDGEEKIIKQMAYAKKREGKKDEMGKNKNPIQHPKKKHCRSINYT